MIANLFAGIPADRLRVVVDLVEPKWMKEMRALARLFPPEPPLRFVPPPPQVWSK